MWTEKHLRMVVEMYNSGKTAAEIAKRLNRTTASVTAKINFYKRIGLIK